MNRKVGVSRGRLDWLCRSGLCLTLAVTVHRVLDLQLLLSPPIKNKPHTGGDNWHTLLKKFHFDTRFSCEQWHEYKCSEMQLSREDGSGAWEGRETPSHRVRNCGRQVSGPADHGTPVPQESCECGPTQNSDDK